MRATQSAVQDARKERDVLLLRLQEARQHLAQHTSNSAHGEFPPTEKEVNHSVTGQECTDEPGHLVNDESLLTQVLQELVSAIRDENTRIVQRLVRTDD